MYMFYVFHQEVNRFISGQLQSVAPSSLWCLDFGLQQVKIFHEIDEKANCN